MANYFSFSLLTMDKKKMIIKKKTFNCWMLQGLVHVRVYDVELIQTLRIVEYVKIEMHKGRLAWRLACGKTSVGVVVCR